MRGYLTPNMKSSMKFCASEVYMNTCNNMYNCREITHFKIAATQVIKKDTTGACCERLLTKFQVNQNLSVRS